MGKKCEHCGEDLGLSNFCIKCGYDNDTRTFDMKYLEAQKGKPQKAKDSTLSIVAMAIVGVSLFIFNWIAVGGIICALVDLCANKDDGKRHVGSWLAIILGTIVLFIYRAMFYQF